MINQELGLSRISLDNHYHNLETGQFEKFEKIKPIQPIRGSALVELFDGVTGKKKEEVLSENIINDSLNRYFYQFLIDSILLGANQGMIGLLFGNLVFTDYTGAEDATLRSMRGNVVAWANKYATYVGADTLRGTLNQASSGYTDASTIKFVFDWPTTAGNGTFKTLWWLPNDNNVLVTTPFCCYVRHIGGYMNTYSYPSCFYKLNYYYINGTTIYKRTLANVANTSYVYDSSVLVKALVSDDSAMKGPVWDGTNFWCYGATNDKFYKYDTSFNLVTSWGCAETTYNPGWKYCCHGGKIYTYRRVDATTWNLYKFATGGTLEATYNLYGSYSQFTDTEANSVSSLVSDGTSMFLSCYGNPSKMLEFDGSGNVLSNTPIISTISNSSSSYITCFDEHKHLLLHTNVYSYPTLQIFNRSPAAQNLLPAAITKTSANTMKITYQFNLDLSGL